jgi:hypothetical protein
LIIKTVWPILATACGISRSIIKSCIAGIVDRGKLRELVEQNLARHIFPVKRHGVASDLTRFRRLRYGSPIEVEVINVAARWVGGHIEKNRTVALKTVDLMI